MSLNVFLKVVEIQTKLASLFPFIIGVLFSMTYFGEVQWGNTLVFFIGMVVFDMATTAINNYMDFKKAKSDAVFPGFISLSNAKPPIAFTASSSFL